MTASSTGGGPLALITRPALAPIEALLPPSVRTLRLWSLSEDARSRAEVATAEVVITSGVGLPIALQRGLGRLRLVACVGSGFEMVDLDDARARGIAITNTGGENARDVADHAVALTLAMTNRLQEGDRLVRSGAWAGGATLPLRRAVSTLTIGVLGLGAIGRGVADRMAAFGCRILWWGPRDKPSAFERAEGLMDLASRSDVLVVAARADDSNRGLIDADVLAALGPQGVLINVSRGAIVVEDALANALAEGRLAGAGLDVLAVEPGDGGRLAALPNVLFTPHIAGVSTSTLDALLGAAARNVAAFLKGDSLPNPVLTSPRPYP